MTDKEQTELLKKEIAELKARAAKRSKNHKTGTKSYMVGTDSKTGKPIFA